MSPMMNNKSSVSLMREDAPPKRKAGLVSACILIAIFLVLGGVSPAQNEVPPGEEDSTDVLDVALEAAGIEAARLRPDPLALMASGAVADQQPMLRAVLADPLRASYRVGLSAERFCSRLDAPTRLFIYTVGLTNANISRGYIGNPLREIDEALLDAGDPLDEALRRFADAAGDFDYRDQLPTVADLPNPYRHELARLIAAIASGERFRRRAFRELPDDLDPADMLQQAISGRFDDFDAPDYRLYIDDVEYEALYAGMLDIIAAVQDFDDMLDSDIEVPRISWSLDTPRGRIIFDTTTGDSQYEGEPPLLLVDLGGDDVYYRDTRPQSRAGISVIYDRAGTDEYRIEPNRGSAAIFGYGLLWDVSGDDTYNGDYLSQAGAIFGASVHIDEAGDDTYTSSAYSQAYALAGASLLLDMDGTDTYESVISSQASAGPYGAAVLIDNAGSDRYTLKNEPLLDPSPQSRKHNVSMGQGTATGIRADLSDGRSVTGGTALLIDRGGDDVYTAQVFAQGVGFLSAMGGLIDGGGSDVYQGVWYVQGSGAHRAGGVLIDRGDGDDSYTAEMYTSIGVGHDLSTGFLYDEGGNDTYRGRGLVIGAGNDNGVGILVDGGGDDSYTINDGPGYGLGGAKLENWGTARENYPGVGLFFDLGGSDKYTLPRKGPANDAVWKWPREYPDLDLVSESGAGVDGTWDNPFFATARTPPGEADDRRLQEAWKARRAYRERVKALPGQAGGPEP